LNRNALNINSTSPELRQMRHQTMLFVFWSVKATLAGQASRVRRASGGSVLFLVAMRFRRLFRTFCPEIRRQEILLQGPT
jgi:hypothetical protein